VQQQSFRDGHNNPRKSAFFYPFIPPVALFTLIRLFLFPWSPPDSLFEPFYTPSKFSTKFFNNDPSNFSNTAQSNSDKNRSTLMIRVFSGNFLKIPVLSVT
jgi:hypothetical protein